MKILVPVDPYESSYAAYKYAVHFAALLDANITLLYVINSVFSTSEVISYDPYLEMENTAKEKLQKYKADFKEETKGNVPNVYTFIDVMFGIPGMAIPEYAETHNMDMIIMGVRDKHGFFDRLLGSSSSETLKAAKCPVLVIHNDTEFKKPEKILFAFDKRTDLDEALEKYKNLNNILKAKTDFLHINVKKKDDVSEQKAEIVSELFEKDNPTFAFEVKTLSGNEVVTGLYNYCYFENIDIVTMIHRKEGLFSNFLKQDKSIKIAQKFHLPVIVFQED
jgi:nucleotide-binding universal stress UspA family protein